MTKPVAFQEELQGFMSDFGIGLFLVKQARSISVLDDSADADMAPGKSAAKLRRFAKSYVLTALTADVADVQAGDRVRLGVGSGPEYIASNPKESEPGFSVLQISPVEDGSVSAEINFLDLD